MNDMLKISKATLGFEINISKSSKSIDTIELTNVDPMNRVGFKIKSTNVSRYLVSPSSGIIDPLKTIKVDFMLTMNENEDISQIKDKFRLYCLRIDDETVTRQNIDLYIRRNEQNIKKSTLRLNIIDKSGKEEEVPGDEPTLYKKEKATNLLEGAIKTKPQSTSGNSVICKKPQEINEQLVTESELRAENGLNGILIEKENDIAKLKESNTILEKDISKLRDSILDCTSLSTTKKNVKLDTWKMVVVFLVGTALGIMLNSNY